MKSIRFRRSQRQLRPQGNGWRAETSSRDRWRVVRWQKVFRVLADGKGAAIKDSTDLAALVRRYFYPARHYKHTPRSTPLCNSPNKSMPIIINNPAVIGTGTRACPCFVKLGAPTSLCLELARWILSETETRSRANYCKRAKLETRFAAFGKQWNDTATRPRYTTDSF